MSLPSYIRTLQPDIQGILFSNPDLFFVPPILFFHNAERLSITRHIRLSYASMTLIYSFPFLPTWWVFFRLLLPSISLLLMIFVTALHLWLNELLPPLYFFCLLVIILLLHILYCIVTSHGNRRVVLPKYPKRWQCTLLRWSVLFT